VSTTAPASPANGPDVETAQTLAPELTEPIDSISAVENETLPPDETSPAFTFVSPDEELSPGAPLPTSEVFTES
jgi:hypothetical protein